MIESRQPAVSYWGRVTGARVRCTADPGLLGWDEARVVIWGAAYWIAVSAGNALSHWFLDLIG